MAAISGPDSITERGRSRSDARHPPANTAVLSNPLKAPSDIFVNTFSVRREKAGKAAENGLWLKGAPLVHLAASRYSIKAPSAMVMADPLPMIHFPKCSPRAF